MQHGNIKIIKENRKVSTKAACSYFSLSEGTIESRGCPVLTTHVSGGSLSTRGGGMCRDSVVKRFKVAEVSNTTHPGLQIKTPWSPETAGDTKGETKTLGLQ